MSVRLVWRAEGRGNVWGCSHGHPRLSCWLQEHCTAFSHFSEEISTL